MPNNHRLDRGLVVGMLTLSLGGIAACGGGGSGGDSVSDTTNTTSGGGDVTDNGSNGGTVNTEGEVLSSITVGIDVPTNIAAVPTDNGSGGDTTASFTAMLKRLSSQAKAATADTLPADSDYSTAIPSVYVEERSLDQFEIIETVFGALQQTNYADEENVNQGPYIAVIGWEQDENGRDVKELQEWTVDSRMIVLETLPADVTRNTTGDVNRLLVWIPERDRFTGEEQLIKAEFLIYSAPDLADDGSLSNFGEWDMNVLMQASATGVDVIDTSGPDQFFVANARIGADGRSVLQVHDRFTQTVPSPSGTEQELAEETRGILVRDGTSGYGKVSYPDWESCWRSFESDVCANGVPENLVNYAYNANYLGLQEIVEDQAGDTVYKDRILDGAIRVVHRYEMFFADANSDAGIGEGDSVEKHVSFGFPVTYQSRAEGDETVTFDEWAYYGAWQGRHQLWGSDSIETTTDGTDGTLLTRENFDPTAEAETFRLKEFDGTVTRRNLVTADLADIADIPVETWLNENYDLFYYTDPNGDTDTADAGWYYCEGENDWGSFPPVCRTQDFTATLDLTAAAGSGSLSAPSSDSLLANLTLSEDDRRWINISSCDDQGNCAEYMYLASDPGISGFTFSGANFYQATWGDTGLAPQVPAATIPTSDGQSMWVSIGGSVYVAYTGDFDGPVTTTGWVSKTLVEFDERTWTPTFDETADRAFTPERGYEYYMNANGKNYVVTRTTQDTSSAAAYRARFELQTAANPLNTNATASILPSSTSYLAMPWDDTVKLTLVDDPADPNYLLLEVLSDDAGNYSAGQVYDEDSWGLTPFNSNNQPLDADGVALTSVDDWGWADPALNDNREPIQFNYEYAGNDGNNWGKQQFLVDAVDGTYEILSDPIALTQVTLYDNLGADSGESVSLQFDGWMHGLPDIYHELERNDWSILGLGDNVRRLLDGQEVQDTEGTRYFVRPMETSLFLGEVTAFPNGDGQPDITAADSVNLDSVPDYVHHEMGARPTQDSDGNDLEPKYSEGNAL